MYLDFILNYLNWQFLGGSWVNLRFAGSLISRCAHMDTSDLEGPPVISKAILVGSLRL